MNRLQNALHTCESGVKAVEKSVDELRCDFWRLICFGREGTAFTASRWRTLLFWPIAKLGILVISFWFALTTLWHPADGEVAASRPESTGAHTHARMHRKVV